MQHHIKLPEIQGRTFFVGDIHGEYTALMRQLEDTGFDFEGDRLIAVGDLIDRGLEVIRCLNLLNEPWFYSVLGNHELMFVKGLEDNHIRGLHLNSGGDWLYDLSDEVQELLVGLVKSRMPLTIQVAAANAEIGVVHATSLGCWSNTIIDRSDEHYELMTWDFSKAEAVLSGDELPCVDGIDLVVSGHHGVSQPIFGGNHLWIDTFYKTGRFTLISAERALSMV